MRKGAHAVGHKLCDIGCAVPAWHTSAYGSSASLVLRTVMGLSTAEAILIDVKCVCKVSNVVHELNPDTVSSDPSQSSRRSVWHSRLPERTTPTLLK